MANQQESEMGTIIRVKGRDLKVGTVLAYMGRHAKTLTGFGERYTHPAVAESYLFLNPVCRSAQSGDWGMTVFDDDYYEVFAMGESA